MADSLDSCVAGYNACTWRSTTKNKFNKFWSCRKNSKCIVQPGLDDYILAAFNT